EQLSTLISLIKDNSLNVKDVHANMTEYCVTLISVHKLVKDNKNVLGIGNQCGGKKHGRMILDSIDHGPLVYPTVEENGQTRPKKYFELTEAQQLQDDCDAQAMNIILHGLPPDVNRSSSTPSYSSQSTTTSDFPSTICISFSDTTISSLISLIGLWSRCSYVSARRRSDKCINKAMAFLSAVASRFPPSNNQLRTSSNPRNQTTIQDGWALVLFWKLQINMGMEMLKQHRLRVMVMVSMDAAYLQQQLLIALKEELEIQSTQENLSSWLLQMLMKKLRDVKVNCTSEDTLQQTSTSGTQSDNAPVYDLDGSTEIKRLQAQLGDQKGKSNDTSCVSDTLDPLSQKLENENVELEFQILNYAKENAHLKTTYKNLFDSISVTRAQTKTIIDSLQTKLNDTISENGSIL
nr:hypothetical protein [Tanacetum cinerariifolium]